MRKRKKKMSDNKPIPVTNLPMCCTDMDIDMLHLFFPERMSPEGRAFVEAHGISKVPLAELARLAVYQGKRIVKIRHVCDQLDLTTGLCKIYENRPLICRQFDCSTRHDCNCKGQGLIQIEE